MKILHLTLKKKWFIKILNGEKNIEYRKFKIYWINRLFEDDHCKNFDIIRFKNGYKKDCPEMDLIFNGTEIVNGVNTDLKIDVYIIAIYLGKLLTYKNIPIDFFNKIFCGDK